AHRAVDQLGMLAQHAPRHGIEEIPVAERLPGSGNRLAQILAQAGGGAPDDKVSTSNPAGVTATVCSHCAERLWSLVTMVQPSASSRMPGLPALIIGSTGKGIPGRSGR